MPNGPQPYAEYFMYVGDKDNFSINWEGWLENHWASDTPIAALFSLRPTLATGFAYQCTTAGQTAGIEPIWPTTIGATVQDGGVTWTCIALDTTSLSTTLLSAVWTAPTGISITGQSVIGQYANVQLDASSAVAGIDYNVMCKATMNDGEIKNGRLVIHVR